MRGDKHAQAAASPIISKSQTSSTAGINLNTASSEELAKLPGIGPDKAWDLMQHRPYRNWEDVKRVPGIHEKAVEIMQRSGATIEP
ncbi:MAG TPA: helix-hairpin-helix domain-containing protein [Clostridia bacterium]|nr:helix-hairpin-helix domain-containing protein [Clostridia bacterium]